MEKLKAVIVGGCSYCAGDELAGELLVPGYTDKKWRPDMRIENCMKS